MTPLRTAAVGLLALATLAGCGSGDDDGRELTPIAAEGRSLMRSNGCASCHGSDGGGGVGPSFVGVFGSEVELDDGSTVTADEDYLARSIRDPGAERVAGYRLTMPTNNLDEEEIDKIVAFIVELGTPEEATE